MAFQALDDGRYKLAISEEILAEIVDVMSRTKIRKLAGLDQQQIRLLGSLLIEKAIKTKPRERIKACRDPDDDKFLECALSARADYLVSGDKDLLDLGRFRGIEIINLRAFRDLLEELADLAAG